MTVVTEEIAGRVGGTDWRSKLLVTPTHTPRPIIANALTALREAPEWAGVIAHDEFALRTMAMRPPPWVRTNGSWVIRPWTDQDDARAAEWLQQHSVGVQVSVAEKAVDVVAHERAFHPIRDYLGGLQWDGEQRVDNFAATYLGAEKSKYHSNVSRCLFVSAVARVEQPGCKVDHATILEGDQGEGKSTAIDVLFDPWFSDDIAELGTKDAAMQVRAAWVIELAELASMQKNEVEKIKAFISRRTDRFRPPFGKRVIQVPRQSIFVGSTNAEHYIKDETGGRRFWPLRCGNISIPKLRRDKEQLWAEAVSLYRDNATWWLEDEDDVRAARTQQDDRRVVDAWEPHVAAHIASLEDVTVGEILEKVFGIEKSKWTQPDQNRVSRCLTGLGWRKGWRSKERCYRRPKA